MAYQFEYRVIRSEHAGEHVFGFTEVHRENGRIIAWTDGLSPEGDSLEALRRDVGFLLDAIKKPVLEQVEVDGVKALREVVSTPDRWYVDTEDGYWVLRHTRLKQTKRVGRIHQPRSQSRVNYRHRAEEMAAERNRAAGLDPGVL